MHLCLNVEHTVPLTREPLHESLFSRPEIIPVLRRYAEYILLVIQCLNDGASMTLQLPRCDSMLILAIIPASYSESIGFALSPPFHNS